MKFLEIKNDGYLDIRLAALMGGSTKSSDVHKIGQFGTGLKYVLAYMFRNKFKFNIFIGEEKVKMRIKEENIQGQKFEILYVDNKRTSITTNMGGDWEPWMIVRELYSNALDEGGEYYGITEDEEGELGKTTFQIELTPKFMAVFNDWSKYFIVDFVPMFENERFSVYPSGKTLKLYKQGILIYESEQHSMFNYDIKSADLNELRQFQGSLEATVYKCLMEFDQKTVEYFLENITEDHYEGNMDFNYWKCLGKYHKSWEEAVGKAKIIHQKAIDDITARELPIDTTSVVVVPKKLYTHLTKQFEGIGALRVAKEVNEFYEVMSPRLEEKTKEAMKTLSDIGYFFDPDVKFVFGVFGDGQVLARAIIDQKEVWISEKHEQKDMFSFITMLIEENEHLKTELQDCSRGFQQHFIDLYTKQLLENSGVKI